MSQDGVDVQCQRCLRFSSFSSRGDTRWDCPCGYSYNLRRCSSCGVVSNVRSLQRRGEPWLCVWCKVANDGYTSRDDPATATLGDLAADMARHGLEFASREPQEQARPPGLLDRLAAWQQEFDDHYRWDQGWESGEIRDHWASQATDLAADVRAELGTRARLIVKLWALDS